MIVEVSIGNLSIYSRHTGEILLPDIKVEAMSSISVTGLPAQNQYMLAIDKIGPLCTATFFLHPHITAHVSVGKFDIYLTNTEIIIGCLVWLKDDFFKITQSQKERISNYTFKGYYDFVSIREGETTFIESLDIGEEGKDTDKIASC